MSADAGHETVLRGGAGLFYDASIGTIGSAIGNGFPFAATNAYTLVPFPLTPAQAAPPPITGIPPTGPSALYGADPNLTSPYTWQWNAALEQALGTAQSLTVSYVGAAGRQLYKKFRYNAPNPTFGSSVYITGNGGASDYDALQIKYQRRLSRGLQVLANWTWSHSLDNSSDDQTYTLTPNSINPNLDRGNSDFDVRHAASVALNYQIPSPFRNGPGKLLFGGWALESLFSARTALPVSLIGSSATVNGILFTSRPDVVPGVARYFYGPQYPGGMAYNKAAFTAAPSTRQGNMGRNSLHGFGEWQDNFTIERRFRLTERFGLQFRSEFFNIFNHPNFGAPGNSLTSAIFGISSQTLASSLGGLPAVYQNGGPRSVQLALRLQF